MERIRSIAFINSYLKVKTLKRKLIREILYVVYEEQKGKKKKFRDGMTQPSKLMTPLLLLIMSKTLISRVLLVFRSLTSFSISFSSAIN